MAAERLSAQEVRTAKAGVRPLLLADGKGLYLRVGLKGSKSWIFRYRSGDRQHDMGLGPYPDIGLDEARDRAMAQRQLRLDGIDPMQHKRAGRDAAAVAMAKAISLRECAMAYVKAHQAAWK